MLPPYPLEEAHDLVQNPWTNPWGKDSPEELQAKLDAQVAKARAAEEQAARHRHDLERLEQRLLLATQAVLRLAEQLHALSGGAALPPVRRSFCTFEDAVRLCEAALPPLGAAAPRVAPPSGAPPPAAEAEAEGDLDSKSGAGSDDEASCALPADQEALWLEFNGGSEATDLPGVLERRPSSVGVTFGEYALNHARDYSALKALEPNEGWCYRCTRGGVAIYTKEVEGMPQVCFKGVVEIDTRGHGIKSIAEALKAHGNRQNWDEMCVSSRVVEEYPPFYSVAYFRFTGGTPFNSDREMVMACRIFFESPDVIYAASESISHEECPENQSFVRATLHGGGYVIRATGQPDVFSVMFVGCVDCGGWVPGWIQGMVAWRQPLSLATFREHFEDAAREGGRRFLEVRGFDPDGSPGEPAPA